MQEFEPSEEIDTDETLSELMLATMDSQDRPRISALWLPGVPTDELILYDNETANLWISAYY